MEKIITAENIRSFAYINDKACKRPIRGIAVEFFGLGGQQMFSEDTERGIQLGEKGILYFIPYLNPWAWMNGFAVKETDAILEAIEEKFQIKGLPLISTGGSMGGLSSLIYTRYAARTPDLCVANCPVCDLPYHYTERPDLPRTLYSAFGDSEKATLQEAMEDYSPLHLAQRKEMPDIPYTVFHCEKDMAVNKGMHSDRFVAAMQAAGRKVEYIAVPERGHTDLSEEAWKIYIDRIASAGRD